MNAAGQNGERLDPWGSFEPYAQLVRSLLPRATGVVLFDARGEMRWSSETTTGPDLMNLVDDALTAARTEDQSAGQVRMLDDAPVYLFWLRDDRNKLVAIIAIVCRATGTTEADARNLSLVQSLLRPAIECLRRDLLSRAVITDLNRAVTALDKDLELLLTDPSTRSSPGDGADELKGLLQQATEHLRCVMAALIVPDKGIVLMRSEGSKPPDSQLVARTHRQLLSMAQLRREPTIINRLVAGPDQSPVPYRILSCPLQHATGRTMGVLALFRDEGSPEFVERDARLVDILARKAAGIIESNYDALSGLYTRPAFEQRVRAVVNNPHRTSLWTALYIDSDQLHVINDNFGMHVGDGVIGQLGELLRRRLPPSAFAARISGDRFAALLPTGLDDAAQFAESLREGATQLSTLHGDSRIHVSISIGVAPLDTKVGELMHSLAAAETACKAAKDRGRNRVEVYQINDLSIVRRFDDINIAARLRDALSADRMRLDAQLILPYSGSGEHTRPHYELLLRMIDEDGETVGPDRFLSAANRYQLMPTIDRWVIEKAIALLRPHADILAKGNIAFAIN